ncbi:heavy-metal-associated domain-containing protein [Chitinimonas sp.]|uniref:heavy-metal-associated domain-containing protein n=1 Tax=Chitinimonas sp. TaxID=1934313 RepID=UPI0035AE7502
MEQSFHIEGMHCGGCVAAVERTVKALPGVSQVVVALADKRAQVSYDPALLDSTQIRAAIEDAGYDVIA